jgi:hypothetical protein
MPQHHSVPAVRIAQVALRPAETAVTPSSRHVAVSVSLSAETQLTPVRVRRRTGETAWLGEKECDPAVTVPTGVLVTVVDESAVTTS